MIPGVVDQNVDGSHFLFHAGDESLHRFLVGHVAHVSVGPDSFFAVGSQSLVDQFLPDVIENDGCACLGESCSDGESYAVRSSGDQGCLTFK